MVAMTMILLSCTPNYLLRRSEHLKQKAIAHGAVMKSDTVFKTVEIPVPGEKTTITIPLHHYHDTTIVKYQDRIMIEQIYKRDTVHEYITCPDSIIRYKSVYSVKEVIKAPPPNHWWRNAALITWVIILAFGVALYLLKR